MPIRKFLELGAYDEGQLKILIDAFQEALNLARIKDKTGPDAEAIALRVIHLFGAGEEDPQQLARKATS